MDQRILEFIGDLRRAEMRISPSEALDALGAGVLAQKMLINGAGATFPYPIYSKWFDEYAKVEPGIGDAIAVSQLALGILDLAADGGQAQVRVADRA